MLNPDNIDDDRVLTSTLTITEEAALYGEIDLDRDEMISYVKTQVEALEKSLDAVLVVSNVETSYAGTDIVVHTFLPAYANAERMGKYVGRGLNEIHHDLMSGNIDIEEDD